MPRNIFLLMRTMGITTIVSLVGGCAWTADSVSADGIVTRDPEYFEYTSNFRETVEVKLGTTEAGTATPAGKLYDCAAGDPASCSTKQTAEDARNRVQDLLLRASAINCAIHEGAIYGSTAWTSTIGDVVATGLAGSAAIVGGLTGQALAAGAGFVTATRAIIEKDVYQTYLAPAIVAEIDKVRKEKYTMLTAKRNQTTREYSVDMAIVDAVEYNDDCSFYKGVASLTAKAGKSTVDSPLSAQIQLFRSMRAEYVKDLESVKAELVSTPTDNKLQANKKLLEEKISKLDKQISTLTQSGLGLSPLTE